MWLVNELRGLKTLRFDENFESDFSHKTNTDDENVKIPVQEKIPMYSPG